MFSLLFWSYGVDDPASLSAMPTLALAVTGDAGIVPMELGAVPTLDLSAVAGFGDDYVAPDVIIGRYA